MIDGVRPLLYDKVPHRKLCGTLLYERGLTP